MWRWRYLSLRDTHNHRFRMRQHTMRWLAALLLLACPLPTPMAIPLRVHPMNGLWGSTTGPEELLLFGQDDGGLAWSPRRIRVLDGGLVLTHHCRDLEVVETGKLTARRGTASAGPAIEADGGWLLQWTASTEALLFASSNLDCGRGTLGTPVVSGQLLDGSVTIRVDWFRSDGGLAHSERIDFTAQRRTRCE